MSMGYLKVTGFEKSEKGYIRKFASTLEQKE